MTTKTQLIDLDLCIQLIQMEYGEQDDSMYLLELLNLEFPDENFTMDHLIEMESILRDEEDLRILLTNLQLC